MTRGRGFATAAFVTVAMAIVLHLPSVRAGFALDDHLQHAMLDGSYAVHRSPLDLYSFVDARRGELPPLRDAGAMPWFSHPELRLRALRPLSSALLWLDHALFGTDAVPQHLHSLGWLAALIVAVALLYRELLPAGSAALGIVAFAVDPAHVTPVSWLANRNALVAGVFGTLAILWHVRWRERGGRARGWLAAALFALSLAAGEYALGAIAYAVAYELLAVDGPLGQRLLALRTALGPLAAYLAVHIVLGYGAVGSTGYVHPLNAPLDFLWLAVVNFPSLLLAELLTVPSEPTHAVLMLGLGGIPIKPLLGVIAMQALLAVGILLALRRTLADGEPRERRHVRFLLAGVVLSLVPMLGTYPSTRLLVLPSLGGAAVVATLLTDWWQRLRGRRARAGVVRFASRSVVCVVLLLGHLVLAPLATAAGSVFWLMVQDAARGISLRAEIDDRRVAEQDLVLINSVETRTLMYPPYDRRLAGRPAPRRWHVLAMTPDPLLLERKTADVLELSANNGSVLAPSASLFRAAGAPLLAGESVTMGGISVTVLELDGWWPRRIRCRFDASLDDAKWSFLTWSLDGLKRFRMPAVGGRVVVSGGPAGALAPPRP
jgi:hypothetical protein